MYGWAHLPLRTDFLDAAERWQENEQEIQEVAVQMPSRREASGPSYISQEEIDAIFAAGRKNQNKKQNDRAGYRRFHRGHRREEAYGASTSSTGTSAPKKVAPKENCILVDGYNVIHAWPHLRELMALNIGSARDRLIEEMSNYQGYVGGTLILVFDAYKVRGNAGSVEKHDNVFVVYTKEAETADQYIEKTVHEMASKYRITVATSDGLEQMIIWGDGATRMSSLGLLEDLKRHGQLARENYGITES